VILTGQAQRAAADTVVAFASDTDRARPAATSHHGEMPPCACWSPGSEAASGQQTVRYSRPLQQRVWAGPPRRSAGSARGQPGHL